MIVQKIIASFLALFTSVSFSLENIGVGNIADRSYQAPEIEISEYKNVILIIGDGMGFNSLEKTKHDLKTALPGIESFAHHGESRTASATSSVTDSAAGGTALACGIRTANNAVGVYPADLLGILSHPMNLSELAVSKGKLAGIITTDETTGATPAAFSVHAAIRQCEPTITNQQLDSDLTLIWGASTMLFPEKTAAAKGFSVIENRTEMESLTEGSRSFGQFTDALWHRVSGNNMPTLTEMAMKAIDLLDDDEDGFFLMIEAANIDKQSHSKDGEGMMDAVMSLDDTVSAVLDYADKDGETLVILTADHETGGITKTATGEYKYTSGDHTGVNVPIFVYGSDEFLTDGEIMPNHEVSRRIALAMGESAFPIRVK